MKTVTAALIARDNKFLICRRRADQPHPLKWEFAGGKVEDGEEAAACLRRELAEELDIEADIGPLAAEMVHQYPGMQPIRLLFFSVTQFRGEPRNLVFEEIRWVERERLVDFDFLEADRELVARIAAGELKMT